MYRPWNYATLFFIIFNSADDIISNKLHYDKKVKYIQVCDLYLNMHINNIVRMQVRFMWKHLKPRALGHLKIYPIRNVCGLRLLIYEGNVIFINS